MKTGQPLVSIILRVHNGEQFLDACIESLLSQTHNNIEIIAIDDFSKDSSYNLLKKWRTIDKRLKISLNKKHYGRVITFNRAMRKAKGAYIAFTYQNDVSAKTRIARQLTYLTRHPKIAAVGCQAVFIDEKGKQIGKSAFPLEHTEIHKILLPTLPLQFESVMINKEKLPKDLLRFNHGFHPLVFIDMIMRIVTYGQFANLNAHLYYHRTAQPEFSISRIFSFAQLWIKSFLEYDYRPSLGSLFSTPRFNQ